MGAANGRITFDQPDGMELGHQIAGYIAANSFGKVPELATGTLAILTLALVGQVATPLPLDGMRRDRDTKLGFR